jgi:hypothetical protein
VQNVPKHTNHPPCRSEALVRVVHPPHYKDSLNRTMALRIALNTVAKRAALAASTQVGLSCDTSGCVHKSLFQSRVYDELRCRHRRGSRLRHGWRRKHRIGGCNFLDPTDGIRTILYGRADSLMESCQRSRGGTVGHLSGRWVHFLLRRQRLLEASRLSLPLHTLIADERVYKRSAFLMNNGSLFTTTRDPFCGTCFIVTFHIPSS